MNPDDTDVEDLELLSFSIPPLQFSKQLRPASLPLKAVYRDTLVGFRYAYPYPAAQPFDRNSANQAYRRFQITFSDTSDVATFIDIIHTVCPCKPHLEPKQGNFMSDTSTSQSQPVPPLRTSTPGYFASVDSLTSPQENEFSSAPQAIVLPLAHGHAQLPRQQNHGDTESTSLPKVHLSSPVLGMSYEDFMQKLAFMVSANLSSSAPEAPNSSQKMPSSSSPEASPGVEYGPTLVPSSSPPTSGNINANEVFQASGDDLERIVAEIIHEDSFQNLLEKLDQLWRLKHLCNIPS
ncbi:hypothetical protein AX16_005200 [Volvariella volvacea WC 439]|nr:hypothetical protein AX16_005200 [Volvariella volvacea WC 439]